MNNYSKIFIADDDYDDCQFFSEVLMDIDKSLDLNIYFRGEEIINALIRTESFPDIIFLDINMPGVTGIDALRWIRSYEGLEETPVVMISTSDSVDMIDNVYMLGANLYFVKPNDYNQFKTGISKILQGVFDSSGTVERAGFLLR